ncbi:MAG: hypothetical protein ACU0BF_08245 [Paracoccaceae bacterium]
MSAGDIALAAVGVLVVAVVLYDFLRTTIAFAGLGPISRGIGDALWSAAMRAVPWIERMGGPSLHGAVGPAILIAIAGMWIVLHLIGYTLLFSVAGALAGPDSGLPATPVETVAFAGSALSTLGASTVAVTTGWWDVLSMIAAVNGMIVLTLAVSFILGILQTTTAARAFAARLTARMDAGGEDPALVASLGSELTLVGAQMAASPLPGMFVPRDEAMNFAAAIVRLADAMDRHGTRATPGDLADLVEGVRILGRNAERRAGRDDPARDIAAAASWARRHSLRDL